MNHTYFAKKVAAVCFFFAFWAALILVFFGCASPYQSLSPEEEELSRCEFLSLYEAKLSADSLSVVEGPRLLRAHIPTPLALRKLGELRQKAPDRMFYGAICADGRDVDFFSPLVLALPEEGSKNRH